MPITTSVREQQKLARRKRLFDAGMRLFRERGFNETTVSDIAKAAEVSRGTFFNYYPYKEGILIDYFSDNLTSMRTRLGGMTERGVSPLEALYAMFDELAAFVEANRDLILPLSYELLNPDPERSKRAYTSLPLTEVIYSCLTQAREASLIRSDFSRERLARTIANAYFLTALQWAAYRQDRSIHEELRKALQLTLEGMVV